ncbi:hypothetical protein GCM10010123_28470 [Pilimelia anulata]|uniref:Potassium channel domain-containing protein n=1 Tax=Pilimelia anulata TaxID=53371 RepID=A0A8J3B676_9ACTN|nr:potassium channel family protein [Pilimelia anulata]GGJ96775.1 hypothetical protein GCM10010123_28470 [Pilimelia anulata]
MAGGARRPAVTLVALLLVYALIVAFDTTAFTGPLRIAGVAVALVGALRWRRRRLAPALAVAGVAFGLSVAASVTGAGDLAVALSAGAMLLVVAAATAAVGRTVLRPATEEQAVAGALSVYLLLALFFATLHQLLAAVTAGPYVHGVDRADDTAGFLYFSVITITTVGLGDLTPVGDAARAVTLSEALVGQLYLVAIVGAVVSAWTRKPRPDHPDPH